jgi:hypothetical protein
MRLAKILTDEADALILRFKQRPSQEAMNRALNFTQSLARDAYMAYLDGKNARAKALNKLADKVRLAALRMKIAA